MTAPNPETKWAPIAATIEGPSIDMEYNAMTVFADLNRMSKSLGLAIVFSGPNGRNWPYKGKRARVVDMLASNPTGITQHDTLPWHTRLGGTIHALRQDGLEISTELEGPYRHARYRLHTPGRIVTRKSGPAA